MTKRKKRRKRKGEKGKKGKRKQGREIRNKIPSSHEKRHRSSQRQGPLPVSIARAHCLGTLSMTSANVHCWCLLVLVPNPYCQDPLPVPIARCPLLVPIARVFCQCSLPVLFVRAHCGATFACVDWLMSRAQWGAQIDGPASGAYW